MNVLSNSLCMVPSALSDLTVLASGLVAKNSAIGLRPASCTIFSDETGSEYG